MPDGPAAGTFRPSGCRRPCRQAIERLSPAWRRLRRRKSARLRSCRWIETFRIRGHLSHALFRDLFLDLDLCLLQSHASWIGLATVAVVPFLGPTLYYQLQKQQMESECFPSRGRKKGRLVTWIV